LRVVVQIDADAIHLGQQALDGCLEHPGASPERGDSHEDVAVASHCRAPETSRAVLAASGRSGSTGSPTKIDSGVSGSSHSSESTPNAAWARVERSSTDRSLSSSSRRADLRNIIERA